MRKILTALALFASAAHAEPITFKGIAMGTPKADLLAKFPSLECKKPMRSFQMLGEEHCTVKVSMIPSDRTLYSYADRPAWDASFSIVGGHVEGFQITINPDSYEAVRNALKLAHGGGKESQRALQTRAGATLLSRTWEVATPDGEISVIEHATRIDEGGAGGTSNVLSEYRRRVRQGDPTKGRADL